MMLHVCLEKDLALFPIKSEKRWDAIRERVQAATQLESLEHKMRRMTSRESWFEKNAKAADLEMDDHEV